MIRYIKTIISKLSMKISLKPSHGNKRMKIYMYIYSIYMHICTYNNIYTCIYGVKLGYYRYYLDMKTINQDLRIQNEIHSSRFDLLFIKYLQTKFHKHWL